MKALTALRRAERACTWSLATRWWQAWRPSPAAALVRLGLVAALACVPAVGAADRDAGATATKAATQQQAARAAQALQEQCALVLSANPRLTAAHWSELGFRARLVARTQAAWPEPQAGAGAPLSPEAAQRRQQVQAQMRQRSQQLKDLARQLAAAVAAQQTDTALALARQVVQLWGSSGPAPNLKPNWKTGQSAAALRVARSGWQLRERMHGPLQVAAVGSLSGLVLDDSADAERPVPADLAFSPLTQPDAAVIAKVAELAANPVALQNWVRNNVRFVPGWGVTQAAPATLMQRQGNAYDIATLLVSMLRQAQVPARYVYGTIELSAGAAQRWLGADLAGATQLLTSAGVPARLATNAAGQPVLQLEHVWVEAFVSGVPSRGGVRASATLPADSWWSLDAAFKTELQTPAQDLLSLLGQNPAGVSDALQAGAQCSADFAADLNLAALQEAYARYRQRAASQLAASGDTLGDLLGRRQIQAENYAVLLGTQPYAVSVRSAGMAELPAALRHRLRLQLGAPGLAPVIDVERDISQLQGRRLALVFVPEAAADASTLAALLPTGALPLQIPAYLVRMKAELRLDDELLASGGSWTLGETLSLQTTLGAANGNLAGGGSSTVVAGELHAWVVNGQGFGEGGVEAAAQRVNTLQSRIDAAQLAGLARHGAAIDALAGLAAAYAANLDASAKLFQRAAGMREVRLPTLVRAIARLEPTLEFGLLSTVRAAGVALVVDRLASATAPAMGATKDRRIYAQQSLERGSAAAHQVLDKVLGNANAADAGSHSALKDLARASAAGQRIYRIDSANAASILPLLAWPEALKASVQQAAADGLAALVATAPVTSNGLTMTPAVVEDPRTGAGSYTVTAAQAPWASVTGQIGGAQGWLGLLDSAAAAPLISAALPRMAALLNTSRSVLGDVDGIAWSRFVAQNELVDTLFAAALNTASSRSACDWLGSVLASQLGSGLVLSSGINHAPEVTSIPIAYAAAGSSYSYAVTALDADGDPLRYALAGADGALPTGLSIGSGGLVSWVGALPGSYALVVRVDDGVATVEQRFTLTVGTEPAPLELQAALAPSIANPGEAVTLTVLASGGNGGAITRSATLNGAPLALNSQGQATFAAPAAGVHRVGASASAAPVNGSAPPAQARELLLTVRDATDATPPLAAITSPQADSEVTTRIPVIGTATDARFAYYQLLLRQTSTTGDPPPWQEIARGLSPVANGTLGTLDPATLSNGAWELGLRVVDVNGQHASVVVPLEVSRERKLGQFRISFNDVRSDATGLPLMLTRTYDSTKKDVASDFGYGWSASASDVSVSKNMALGLQWVVQSRDQVLQQCLLPLGKRRVTVTLPDGGVYRFQARNEPECAFVNAPALNLVFDPLPLPVGGSGGAGGSSAGSGQLEVIVNDLVEARGGMLVNTDTGEVWNPPDFKFTSADGFQYILKEGVGVVQVTDPYGNTVAYGADGYRHSASIGIELTRDAQGRITQATDPQGRSLSYSYNAQGELASVTDRLGQTTRFAYGSTTRASAAGSVDNRHLLVSITDPRGEVVMYNRFDEFGRLQAAADANGQSAQQSFDDANNQMRVVDRRGHASRYRFDDAGNVTQIVDALGGVTELSYDANGNELTRKDPLGHLSSKTYDPATGLTLTQTDPLGRTSTTTYFALGKDYERRNPLSLIDARGNVTSYAYPRGQEKQPGTVPSLITEPLDRTTAIELDSRGNLRSLNVAGIASRYDYDSQGRRTQETDGLGHVTRYTFDANGNELTRSATRSVDGMARSETSTRSYDSDNRVTAQTDATGATRRSTYNKAGKLETSTDALGRVTRHVYDGNARLVRTEHPDGSIEAISYDANGNETSRTDRLGRLTRMNYDALNRQVATTHPDGSTERTEYDAAGRVTATVDASGARQTMAYDAAGQHTASIDASGRRTEHRYDANGNRIETTHPDGRLTRHIYDALNRLTKTEFPDGSSHSISYRPDGRKAAETDPRGTTSTYGYDAKGQLTSVIQSGVQTPTTYAYDEQGAKTVQTDALGRELRWSYDAAGRTISRTLPDGARESFQYDLEGQLIAKTSFGGQRIQSTYDAMGRELTRIIPTSADTPARTIAWTYDAEGRRLTQTEGGPTSTQGITTYRYDAKGRLIEQQTPQGTLSWAYDEADRITERSTSQGTTRYAYDGDGRMTQLTAPDGKRTSYGHDVAGRLVQSVQQLDPGTELVTQRRYDAQDRQTRVAHSRKTASAISLIAGQAISRGASGVVSRIDTYGEQASFNDTTGDFTGNPSRVQVFTYDANARLTSEAEYKGADIATLLASPTAAATLTTNYGYDQVGNRIAKTVTTAAGTESTAYAYDSNDRLTTETLTTSTGSSITTEYTWDGNGNLQSKTSPSEYTGYVFDADNRLVEVRRGSTSANASTVALYGYDADGQRIRRTTGGATTRYLIDPTTIWPQVVLESQGAQTTAYTWGDTLRQQITGSAGGASPTDALVPLPGHLNTTLAAVDSQGSVVERYDTTAFGELDNLTPKLNHQYTGEYWEPQARLTYLRARWYDPASGRLPSLDPAMGKATDARSLNRYAYVHGDPVHGSDPSGLMGMGEIGAGLNIQGVLANTARHFAVDYLQSRIFGGDDTLDGPPSLYEMLIAMTMKAVASAGSETAASLGTVAGTAALAMGPTHGHHTIPVYMCGGKVQEYVDLGVVEHAVLHAELLAFVRGVNVAGVAYKVLGNRRAPGAKRPPLFDVARSPYGRQAIASGLSAFYQLGGLGGRSWADMGRGQQSGHKLLLVLVKEAMKFSTYNHTWPTCMR